MRVMRCPWAEAGNEQYVRYHDEEWGVPVHCDKTHFEFLILEAAQAGLSWVTILKRRAGYARAFSQFDPQKVVAYDEAKVEELMQDAGIIRNRLKITSAINNARHFLAIQKEFGSFDAYVWQFVGNTPIQNSWRSLAEVPCETKESKALSKDLKARGFAFVGPTVMYAYMQATGLVNDHLVDCCRYEAVKKQVKAG